MAKRILLPILFLLALGAHAQHWQLKFGGGLSSQYGAARSVGAYKIGVGYEYEFDQRWTVAPSLVFYGKGFKDTDRLVAVIDDDGAPLYDEEGNPVYSRMSRSTSANYIELPLLFSYYWRTGPSRYVVLSAGPYAAVGLFGKVKTKGDGEQLGSDKLYYDGDAFGGDGLRRFDAGVQAFAGYQFATGLTLGVEADFGLTRTSADGGRTVTGLVSLTYRFD